MGTLPHHLEVEYLTSSERSCVLPASSIGYTGDVALQTRTSVRTTVDSTMARRGTGHVSSTLNPFRR
jgi:hypothetical protein